MISLSALQPKIIDIEIEAYGETQVIPILPLTSVQWQNATIGLERPNADDYKVRKLVDGKATDVINYADPEYVDAVNTYAVDLKMRRLAMALSGGGGIKELKGKDIQAQVEILKSLDVGIVNSLLNLLEGMATRTRAKRFQPAREDNHEAVPQNGVVTGEISELVSE